MEIITRARVKSLIAIKLPFYSENILPSNFCLEENLANGKYQPATSNICA